MAAEVGFARAGELPGELAGARIGAEQVERAAETLGREIAADERAVSLEGFPEPAASSPAGPGRHPYP